MANQVRSPSQKIDLLELNSPLAKHKFLEVLDNYIKSAPNSENALDIFKSEWASMFPGSVSLAAGVVPLFEDNRIARDIEQFNGVQGKHIVELGPLQAGHTYML